MKTMKKGFTLIELMIVVAIIGILAAIAIPKFADLIKKSKEGATKGSLGALRSAITIYYGEQEGIYPTAVTAGTGSVQVDEGDDTGIFANPTGPFLTKYLDKMPSVKLGIAGLADTDACVFISTYVPALMADNLGKWWYRGNSFGELHVSHTTTDTKGASYTSW
ncbi:MAG TPA: hypothetical protein DCP53_00685 [Elusimicrobia bacterium]|nr:MAG: hypothetical protein A2551_03840 [Elusimicrobia bacterium RIFOXYD2_FULL_34_30]HAM37908.1 hypothetical protein [Elusimicrobiota bacterium]